MLLSLGLSFLLGVAGGCVAIFLASFISKRLKKPEIAPTIRGMPIPGRHRGQKRTPKALTDLMAYQMEIKDEGENRG